jgi:hypothetical protein
MRLCISAFRNGIPVFLPDIQMYHVFFFEAKVQNISHASTEFSIFNGLYNEALSIIPDSEDRNDKVFFYIYEKSYPKHSVAIDAAIFTLMAYYFEYCDIFEAPV